MKLLSSELKELKVPNVYACEELLQACIQAMGNHTAVTIGSKITIFSLFWILDMHGNF